MPKNQDVLEVVEDDPGYRIMWWLPEDTTYGAIVGEGGKEPIKTEGTELDWYMAEVVVFKLYRAQPDSDTFGLDSRGFWWSSKSEATRVLSQIKADTKTALQNNKGPEKEWPEWAITAKANGWKPPKAWKP